MAQRRQYIYIIEAGDFKHVKIGLSENPRRRVKQLQTGHHERLHLAVATPGTSADEGRIHEELSHARISGEWFDGSDSRVSRFICDMMSASEWVESWNEQVFA